MIWLPRAVKIYFAAEPTNLRKSFDGLSNDVRQALRHDPRGSERALLCRLAAAVPSPRFHVLRYGGVLAAAHRLRALVVPPPAVDDNSEETEVGSAAHSQTDDKQRPATHRCQYRPWAELMKRTFTIDVDKCDRCGARMRLRALVTAAASIVRYLRHLGEPTEPPCAAR